jgi:hypothetical protein
MDVDRPAVAICSGDGDFAYCISSLRNATVPTMVLYDSDRMSAVHTLLIEAADDAVGVSFSGRRDALVVVEGEGDVHEKGECVVPEEADYNNVFMQAIERSAETSEGWRLSSEAGSLFRKLSPGSAKAAFKNAKQSLVALGTIECSADNEKIRVRVVS